MGKPVISLDELPSFSFDEVHIANRHYETLTALIEKGVPKEKIVIAIPNLQGDHNLVFQYLEDNAYIWDVRYNGDVVITRPMSFHDRIENTYATDFRGSHIWFNDDYARYGTLALLADEIHFNHVAGDVAELGVYQGKFAALLNRAFPERLLYLFDTFTGFAEEDVAEEKKHSSVCGSAGSFGDTSVGMVLGRMEHPENIIIRKGFFPSTIPDEEHTYAFVSIDCDLYAPAIEGIRYFYPRLARGGYIMLHDYNGWFKGIKAAVDDFEKEAGKVVKVPIPDEAGTLVIAK